MLPMQTIKIFKFFIVLLIMLGQQFSITAPPPEQFGVAAAFHDAPLFEDDDAVSIADGREAMLALMAFSVV